MMPYPKLVERGGTTTFDDMIRDGKLYVEQSRESHMMRGDLSLYVLHTPQL